MRESHQLKVADSGFLDEAAIKAAQSMNKQPEDSLTVEQSVPNTSAVQIPPHDSPTKDDSLLTNTSPNIELLTAALTLQRVIRGYLARKSYKKLLEEKVQEKVIQTADVIQADEQFEEVEYNESFEFTEDLESAAVAIQKVYRGFHVRKELKEKFENAAGKILEKNDKNDDENENIDTLNEAAEKIQALYKGHRVRKEIAQGGKVKPKEENASKPEFKENSDEITNDSQSLSNNILKETEVKEEELAAIKIQSTYRGHKTREDLKKSEVSSANDPPVESTQNELVVVKDANTNENLNEEENYDLKVDEELESAAIKIQASYRGFKTREELKQEKVDKSKNDEDTKDTDDKPKNNEDTKDTDDQTNRADDLLPTNTNDTGPGNNDIDLNSEDVQLAAVTIQKNYKGYKTRKDLKDHKASKDDSNDDNIQKESDSKEDSNLPELNEETAAVAIQKHYKGYKTRKDLNLQKNEDVPIENKTEEAKLISEVNKDHSTLDDHTNDDSDELQTAALTIQKNYKGYKTRKELKEDKVHVETDIDTSKQDEKEIDLDLNDPEFEKAAQKIQAGFRGHKTREELKSLRKENDNTGDEKGSNDQSNKNESNHILKESNMKVDGTFESSNDTKAESHVSAEKEVLKNASKEEEEIDIDLTDPEVQEAAKKIQASFRGQKFRGRSKQKSPAQDEDTDSNSQNTDATDIPKDDVKEDIQVNLQDPELAQAATKIQAGFRGHKTREELKQNKIERDDSLPKVPDKSDEPIATNPKLSKMSTFDTENMDAQNAAVTIQKNFKGYKTRKELRGRLDQGSLSITSSKEQTNTPIADESTLVIQHAANQALSFDFENPTKEQISAVKKIQRVYRKHRIDQQLRELKIHLRTVPVLDLSDPVMVEQMTQAARSIQKFFRVHKKKKSEDERKNSNGNEDDAQKNKVVEEKIHHQDSDTHVSETLLAALETDPHHTNDRTLDEADEKVIELNVHQEPEKSNQSSTPRNDSFENLTEETIQKNVDELPKVLNESENDAKQNKEIQESRMTIKLPLETPNISFKNSIPTQCTDLETGEKLTGCHSDTVDDYGKLRTDLDIFLNQSDEQKDQNKTDEMKLKSTVVELIPPTKDEDEMSIDSLTTESRVDHLQEPLQDSLDSIASRASLNEAFNENKSKVEEVAVDEPICVEKKVEVKEPACVEKKMYKCPESKEMDSNKHAKVELNELSAEKEEPDVSGKNEKSEKLESEPTKSQETNAYDTEKVKSAPSEVHDSGKNESEFSGNEAKDQEISVLDSKKLESKPFEEDHYKKETAKDEFKLSELPVKDKEIKIEEVAFEDPIKTINESKEVESENVVKDQINHSDETKNDGSKTFDVSDKHQESSNNEAEPKPAEGLTKEKYIDETQKQKSESSDDLDKSLDQMEKVVHKASEFPVKINDENAKTESKSIDKAKKTEQHEVLLKNESVEETDKDITECSTETTKDDVNSKDKTKDTELKLSESVEIKKFNLQSSNELQNDKKIDDTEVAKVLLDPAIIHDDADLQTLGPDSSRVQSDKDENNSVDKKQEEEIDIDLTDPEVAEAAKKIQASFRGNKFRGKSKQKQSTKDIGSDENRSSENEKQKTTETAVTQDRRSATSKDFNSKIPISKRGMKSKTLSQDSFKDEKVNEVKSGKMKKSTSSFDVKNLANPILESTRKSESKVFESQIPKLKPTEEPADEKILVAESMSNTETTNHIKDALLEKKDPIEVSDKEEKDLHKPSSLTDEPQELLIKPLDCSTSTITSSAEDSSPTDLDEPQKNNPKIEDEVSEIVSFDTSTHDKSLVEEEYYSLKKKELQLDSRVSSTGSYSSGVNPKSTTTTNGSSSSKQGSSSSNESADHVPDIFATRRTTTVDSDEIVWGKIADSDSSAPSTATDRTVIHLRSLTPEVEHDENILEEYKELPRPTTSRGMGQVSKEFSKTFSTESDDVVIGTISEEPERDERKLNETFVIHKSPKKDGSELNKTFIIESRLDTGAKTADSDDVVVGHINNNGDRLEEPLSSEEAPEKKSFNDDETLDELKALSDAPPRRRLYTSMSVVQAPSDSDSFNPFQQTTIYQQQYLDKIHGQSMSDTNDTAYGSDRDIEDEDQFDDFYPGNIRQKIMASSFSITDSDYFDQHKPVESNEDRIVTALETITSTDSESTTASASTKVANNVRPLLPASNYSIGNAAITESLDEFVEKHENANLADINDGNERITMLQKKITRGTKGRFKRNALTEEIPSQASIDEEGEYDPGPVIQIKLEQRSFDSVEKSSESSFSEDTRAAFRNKKMSYYSLNVDKYDTAARRSLLQRGNAFQKNSTPDDDLSAKSVSTGSNDKKKEGIAVVPSEGDEDSEKEKTDAEDVEEDEVATTVERNVERTNSSDPSQNKEVNIFSFLMDVTLLNKIKNEFFFRSNVPIKN